MVKTYYREEISLKEALKLGSTGNAVKKVQEWLNLWRYVDPKWKHIVAVDGDYGAQTQKIVSIFQKDMGLKDDGVVGPLTYKKLTEPMRNAFSRIESTSNLRELIVGYAEQHLRSQPKELYNSNKGPWVRAYMDGHEGKEWAWCMGFVQTVLDQAFFTVGQSFLSVMPKTYSCDVVGEHGKATNRLIRNGDFRNRPNAVAPGDVFLVVRTPSDWTHTGIVTAIDDTWLYTIEGNTNDEGSREGFEVCRRMRDYKKQNLDIFKVA